MLVQWLLIAGLAGALVWVRFGAHPAVTAESRRDGDGDGGGGGAGAATAAAAAGRVHLPAAIQQASGLRTAILVAVPAPSGDDRFGEVVAAQGLAETHARLRQSALEVAQWTPALDHARKESARLDALWLDGGNVARKLVEQAHADRAQLEQRAAAAEVAHQSALAAARAEWGAEPARQLDQADGGRLAGVLAGQERLLVLAAGDAPRGLVGLAGSGKAGIPVRRLAPAVQLASDGGSSTWYWTGPAVSLRVGQRVYMPAATRAGAPPGVRVPESAVVWQAGQPWVYLAEDAEHFRRQALQLGAALGDAWFSSGPLRAGAPVVVQGAQLLLSEESRALIRNENGD
jgi:hypothetical protein